jgi:2-oxoglutarate ferredoxin oxidoreductase subunit alpha
MNLGQISLEVERVVAGVTRVVGCHQANGQLLSPATILSCLREGV